MVESSVFFSLQSSFKNMVSAPSLLHFLKKSKYEEKRRGTCIIRSSGHRIPDSPMSLMDSPANNVKFRATKRCRCTIQGGSSEVENENEFTKGAVGRCALAGAAAALLVQCAYRGELAVAAAYSPSVAAYTSSGLDARSSSYSFSGLDRCNPAPNPLSTPLKKNRTGIQAKPSALMEGLSTQSAVTVGTRKSALMVKRPGGYLPRLRHTLLSGEVACASVGVLPMGALSASTFSNSVSVISRLVLALDFSVLRSSFGTSANLLSLCTLVVWMQRSGQLPQDTPVILSQVAFRLFIPCFLMSKVATTLTSHSASNLVALPLMAVAQVIVGAILGKVASQVFFSIPSFQPAVEWSASEAGDSSLSIAVTEQQQHLSRAATKKQALVTAACAFGNSLTLPLVFLSGVLASSEDANRAAGYLALYMVGWSPAMWSVGFKILTAGDKEQEPELKSEKGFWQAIFKWIGSFMNPPLYGVLVGLLIGGTPLSHLFLGGKEGSLLASSSMASDTVGTFGRLRTVTSGILSPVFEAASLLGTATLAVQTVVLATSLGAVMPKTMENSRNISFIEGESEKSQSLGQSESGISKNETVLDTKAFWVISFVRLIVLPCTGIFFYCILQYCNMLPADPIYRLVILAESAMPTAQNLVLLAQLNAGTRPLAGMLAELLLREYALSVIPITMWMAVFLTFTSVT